MLKLWFKQSEKIIQKIANMVFLGLHKIDLWGASSRGFSPEKRVFWGHGGVSIDFFRGFTGRFLVVSLKNLKLILFDLLVNIKKFVLL